MSDRRDVIEEEEVGPGGEERAHDEELDPSMSADASRSGSAALPDLLLARRRAAREAPRDTAKFRRALLRACGRVGFAQHARFVRTVGERVVEGFSIGFVEKALKLLGNVSQQRVVLKDTETELVIEVIVSDDETGVVYSEPVRVSKTVERSILKNGQKRFGMTRSPAGLPVYIVAASAEELRAAEALAVSFALRSCGLRHLSRDLRAECEERISRTLERHAQKNLERRRAELVTAFGQIGIGVDEIARFLGRTMIETTSTDLVHLWKALSLAQESLSAWRQLVIESERRRTARDAAPTCSEPTSSEEKPATGSTFRDKLNQTPFARHSQARAANGAARA
ncbi:MAG: hypothetical protein HUU21_38450 [Polyangiaceae bacterium]|nr:hypothetical protein [Polyangiaceae bacterium]